MKVSVIIPNFNHSQFLKQRIDSINNQTFRDFELIILDDCSTDNSREIISEYTGENPGITTIYNKENSGSPFRQWNLGVSRSKGEFIWIAESDDYAEPGFLEISIRELERASNAAMTFCDSRIIDDRIGLSYLASDRKRSLRKNRADNIQLNHFFENPVVNVSSVLFRKTAYEKAGGADESMKYCSDWSLYLKLLYLGKIIMYIPRVLNVHRIHSASASFNFYMKNGFLSEKVKIWMFMLRKRFSILAFITITINMLKAITLRISGILRMDRVLRTLFLKRFVSSTSISA